MLSLKDRRRNQIKEAIDLMVELYSIRSDGAWCDLPVFETRVIACGGVRQSFTTTAVLDLFTPENSIYIGVTYNDIRRFRDSFESGKCTYLNRNNAKFKEQAETVLKMFQSRDQKIIFVYVDGFLSTKFGYKGFIEVIDSLAKELGITCFFIVT